MIGNAQNFLVFLAIIIVPLYILAFVLFFGYRLKKYGYLGNVLIYIAGALILCFIMMMIVNYSPIDIEEDVKITLKLPVEGTNDTIEKTFT